MKSNSPDKAKGIKFNNAWQTLLLIAAIALAGWNLNDKLEAAIFTEEEVKTIATTAAQEVIYEYKKEDAIVDADDFMKGWINAKDISMDDYILEVYTFKTRVFKGGMLMVDNQYDTRDEMCEKYGDLVVKDLVDKLIRFEN